MFLPCELLKGSRLNLVLDVFDTWSSEFNFSPYRSSIILSRVRVSATVNNCGLRTLSLSLLDFLFTELLTIITHSDPFNYREQGLPHLLAR
jgi:hypothetical protein